MGYFMNEKRQKKKREGGREGGRMTEKIFNN